MSDCFVFTTGSSNSGVVGTINLTGYAQETTYNYSEQWLCTVNYGDNAATIQAKVKACVALMYLTNWSVVIGGSDKVMFFGLPQ